MKGFTVLLIALILWYFAGMYRQTSLMVLAVCILILSAILAGLAFYQRFRLKVRPVREKNIVFKKIEKPIPLTADNASLLPVNRYRLTLALSYSTDKKPVRQRFGGCASGKRARDGTKGSVYLRAPYCGVITCRFVRVRVFDNLSVFSFSRRLQEKSTILVLPVEKNLHLQLPSAGSYDNIPVADSRSPKPGEDHSEVFQIREYRPGDLPRHIHHNYTARSGELWVREFSKENDFIFDLYLDTSEAADCLTDDWDAFYEVIYSVVLALIRKDIRLHVHWYDRQQMGLTDMEVNVDSDAAEMLLQLYLADKLCSREEFYDGTDPFSPGSMLINTKPEWYFGDNLVHRFHKETVEVELDSLSFRL